MKPRATAAATAPASAPVPAFSLMETVLALGIVSSVLVAAFGLIPLGPRAAQGAERRAAEARMVTYLLNRCAHGIPETDFHFSANGSPLPERDRERERAYTAEVRPGDGITLPGNPGRPLRSMLITLRDRESSWRVTRTVLTPP